MALIQINNQVETTATLIADIPVTVGPNRAVQFHNGHSAAIYIGSANVTTSGATVGRPIAANGNLQLWLDGGDKVYAISAAQTAAGAVVVTFSA